MSSSDNPTPATATADATASPPAKRPHGRPKGARGRPLARPHEPAAPPTILNLEEAANALRCTAQALRARCRRAAVVGPDGKVRSELAPGVVAFKFGRNTWRVRFDPK